MFSLNWFTFWQIVPDFILTSLQSIFCLNALTELMLFLKSCVLPTIYVYISNAEWRFE